MIGRFALRLAVGAILIFLVAPLVSVIVSSFSGGPLFVFPVTDITLKWYGDIPPEFFRSLLVSIEVGAGATVAAIVLGVPAALALARGKLPFSRALTTLCLTPLMLPTLVIGVAALQFINALSDYGVSLSQTVLGLTLAHTAFTVPFIIRAVIAGQIQYDRQIEDAAMSLGAAPLRTFLSVTMPLLAPAVASGAILAFLTSFDDVPIALFLGGGNATTLPVQIFNSLQFNLSPAILALSTIITVGVLALVALSGKALRLDRFLGGAERGG